MKGPAWTGSGESSEENSSMISLRSPPDATLEESSPGFSKFACSVEDSAGAAVSGPNWLTSRCQTFRPGTSGLRI